MRCPRLKADFEINNTRIHSPVHRGIVKPQSFHSFFKLMIFYINIYFIICPTNDIFIKISLFLVISMDFQVLNYWRINIITTRQRSIWQNQMLYRQDFKICLNKSTKQSNTCWTISHIFISLMESTIKLMRFISP